ncbi:hypothetical protein BDN71DRAFT_1347833, partial [Pleurotus eryngii]
LTREAIEHSHVKCTAFRYDYGIQYTARQTVFVDKSSFDHRTSVQGKAWAILGQRATRSAFFVQGQRCVSTLILRGSFMTVLFMEFIKGLLDKMEPFPGPNSVIVMDNARIHKNPELTELIEQ